MSGDTFVRHRVQPARQPALEAVKTIRESGAMAPSRQRESTLGEWAASIPKSDWWNLVACNPDLNAPDPEIQTRAIEKLLRSPEGAIYRMREGRY